MDEFQLGPVRVYPALNQIRMDGREVHVQPKAMRVLEVLSEKPMNVVTRDELAERVWNGRAPTDEVIARAVASLRKSLGDAPASPRFIETIPKRGYRLIVEPEREGQTQRSPVRPRALVAMSAIVLLLALAALWSVAPERAGPVDLESLARVAIGLSGYEESPALAPASNRLAFSYAPPGEQVHRIHLVDLDYPGQGPRPLSRPGFDDRYPVWAPNGRDVAFIRRGAENHCAVMRIDLDTGLEELLVDCQASIILPIEWSPDGSTILYSDQRPERPGQYRLFSVPAGGGEPRPLTEPETIAVSDWWPRVAPDGRSIAHIRGTLTEHRIFITDPATGTTRLWGGGGEDMIYGLTWVPDGSGVIYAYRDDGDRYALWFLPLGESEPVHLGGSDWAMPVAGNGRLAAVALNHNLDIVRIDLRDGAPTRAETVFDSSGIDGEPALSPEGRQAVLVSNRSGERTLWLVDVGGESMPRGRELLRPEHGRLLSPSWSSDGRRVAVLEVGGGRSSVWMLDMEAQTAELIHRSGSVLAALSFSADDESLLIGTDATGQWQVVRLTLGSDHPVPVTLHGGYGAKESTDGRWVYYTKHLTDGLYRIPVGQPDREELVLPELIWLDRENWHATERGLMVPLDDSDGRTAGLYLLGEDGDLRIVTPADFYQSVKPEQSVAVDRVGNTALVVRPSFFRGNVVILDWSDEFLFKNP